jgi:ferredoxin-fold anticodon binding domain-containing protein
VPRTGSYAGLRCRPLSSESQGREGQEMKDLLKNFVGKTLRIYTVSGVESYLGVLEEVKDEYVVLKSYFHKDKTFLAAQYIESFKEEPAKS